MLLIPKVPYYCHPTLSSNDSRIKHKTSIINLFNTILDQSRIKHKISVIKHSTDILNQNQNKTQNSTTAWGFGLYLDSPRCYMTQLFLRFTCNMCPHQILPPLKWSIYINHPTWWYYMRNKPLCVISWRGWLQPLSQFVFKRKGTNGLEWLVCSSLGCDASMFC